MAEPDDVDALLEAAYNASSNGSGVPVAALSSSSSLSSSSAAADAIAASSSPRVDDGPRGSGSPNGDSHSVRRSRKSKREGDDDDERSRKRRRSRSKSPPRSSRRRSRSRSPNRSRSRSPNRRGNGSRRYDDRRDRPYERYGGRSGRRPYDRRRSPSPSRSPPLTPEEKAAADAERGARTIFAKCLPPRASEREVKEFFEQAGKVRQVNLIADKHSKRSKGLGYIEYYDKDSVPKAMLLTGQLFKGFPVAVESSHFEKNQAAAAAAAAGPRKLFVGGLNYSLSEEDVRLVFEPFGALESIDIQRDEIGRSRGFAFVHFRDAEDAKKAVAKLNGLDLGGRAIQVRPAVADATTTIPSGLPGSFGGHQMGDLDDDDTGMKLDAQKRATLMQNLQRTQPNPYLPFPAAPGVPPAVGFGTPHFAPAPAVGMPPNPMAVAAAAAAAAAAAVAAAMAATAATAGSNHQQAAASQDNNRGTPSPCVLLRNMFDPAEETEPNWHLDIQEETQEELSQYGKVEHCFVDKDSAGFVYVKFSTVEGAQRAVEKVAGRWFAGKQVHATFLPVELYDSKFF